MNNSNIIMLFKMLTSRRQLEPVRGMCSIRSVYLTWPSNSQFRQACYGLTVAFDKPGVIWRL